jgi:hypothetical protein
MGLKDRMYHGGEEDKKDGFEWRFELETAL